jgi:hypothetical protein
MRSDVQVWDNCPRWLIRWSHWIESHKNLEEKAKTQHFVGRGLVEPSLEIFCLEMAIFKGYMLHSNLRKMISLLNDFCLSKEVRQ